MLPAYYTAGSQCGAGFRHPLTPRIRSMTLWSYPESRTFAELLIDREEDRTLRAVLVGTLPEAERSRPS